MFVWLKHNDERIFLGVRSNCITSTPYYSICCLNECDQVFQQLEAKIAASTTTPSEIFRALETGAYAAWNISELQRKRLDEIARVSGGKIPIHGRLFARWLHFVYPQECPYPHAAGVVPPMTQQQWKEFVGEDQESASDDEIAQHLESEYAKRVPSPNAGDLLWTLEEALLDSTTPSDLVATPVWVVMRIAAQIAMLVGFLSLLRPLQNSMNTQRKQHTASWA